MGIESNLKKRLGNFNTKYYNDGIRGQCVWYVRGRAKEKVGVDTGIRGNAKLWYDQAKYKGRQPENDSIACFNGGNYGHVIFVESVENGLVYYTESNAKGTNKNGYISPDDGVLKKLPTEDFTKRSGYQGCIYLTEYKCEKSCKNTAKTLTNLHYRYKPNGNIAGTLSKGTVVEYIPNTETEQAGYCWIKVKYNGKEYYAAKNYLEI